MGIFVRVINLAFSFTEHSSLTCFYNIKPNFIPMKTKIFFILILSAMSLCAPAQSFYLRAGLGAAVCTAPHLSYQSTETSYEAVRTGLGDGIPVVAAAGYYFSSHFGVELGVDYFCGFSHKTVDDEYGLTSTTKYRGSMLALVPAFVIKFDAGKFSPYARLGVMIGVLNSEKMDGKLSGQSDSAWVYNGKADYTLKNYGGIAIGAQAAVGVTYPLGKILSFFGEVNMDGISWAPKKGKYTKYSVNGEDKLPGMTTYNKTWVFEKKTEWESSSPSSEPQKFSLINFSFANVGLIVGVKINLGK